MVTGFSSGLSSVLSGGNETIVARATPSGAGALAIVRISGSDAFAVAGKLCPGFGDPRPWRARRVSVVDPEGEPVDDAVAIGYRAPRSYTGEDMVELMVHGSTWVVDQVVESAIAGGARRASPGEFTRRAVANGKMDLVQAEAINELIHAETAWQARLAREQRHGALSKRFLGLREDMVAALAVIEGGLDHEEIMVEEQEVIGRLDEIRETIDRLLQTLRRGRRVREGMRIVIEGPPNSGKSTLFNTLLARERAIVTETPGTTRDSLEAHLDIEGVPIVLVDTAGIRNTADPVEREGVRRARQEVAAADLILSLRAVDRAADEGWPIPAGVPRIDIGSKADLGERPPEGRLMVSCHEGRGLAELRRRIHHAVVLEVEGGAGPAAVNFRHADILQRTRACVDAAAGAPGELAAMELRQGIGFMAELFGEVDNDQVLDVVFSSFCVGK